LQDYNSSVTIAGSKINGAQSVISTLSTYPNHRLRGGQAHKILTRLALSVDTPTEGAFYLRSQKERQMHHKKRIALLLALMLVSCSALDGWNPYTAALTAEPRAAPASSPPAPIAQALTVGSSPTPPAKARTWCTVSAQVLHLRSCGSSDCAVIDWLTQGERLEVLAPGDWLKVRTQGGSLGWINSNYCTFGG